MTAAKNKKRKEDQARVSTKDSIMQTAGGSFLEVGGKGNHLNVRQRSEGRRLSTNDGNGKNIRSKSRDRYINSSIDERGIVE